MILSDKGRITIDGSETEMMAEAMCILGVLYNMLAEGHGEDYARQKISSMGEMVVMHEERKALASPYTKAGMLALN